MNVKNEKDPDPYNFVFNPKRSKLNIEPPDVIIIDEISQVSGQFFDIINRKAKDSWDENKPMGGCQVVVVGDFYQLPPVSERSELGTKKRKNDDGKCVQNLYSNSKKGFAFQSKAWREQLNFHKVELTTSKRQTDCEFFEVLNRIRLGEMIEEDFGYLKDKGRSSRLQKHLFNSNEKVNNYNDEQYKKMQSASKEQSYFTAKCCDQNIEFKREPSIKLKVGVEVMLTSNLRMHSPPYLVNGSRGFVRGFMKVDDIVEELLREKESVLEDRKNDDNDDAKYHNNKLFDYIICLIEVLKKAKDEGITDEYPIIEFEDRVQKFKRCILPFRKTEKNLMEVELPLKYAWALTFHKGK